MKIKTDREELVAEMVDEMRISPFAARRLIDDMKISKGGREIGFCGVSGKVIGKITKETR